MLDRVITVEFAIKDDDERRNGNSPDRSHNRSPRRGYDRARSQSPYRRERDSPDYGHGRGRNPSPYRRERASPDYVRGSSRSPNRKERGSPNRRERGSPIRKERGSPNRKERGSPYRKERDVRRDHELSPSPKKEDRETDRNHKLSSSPQTKWSNGDISNGLNPEKRASPEYSHRPSPSPQREEGEAEPNLENFARSRSAYSDAESPPPDRYGRYTFIYYQSMFVFRIKPALCLKCLLYTDRARFCHAVGHPWPGKNLDRDLSTLAVYCFMEALSPSLDRKVRIISILCMQIASLQSKLCIWTSPNACVCCLLSSSKILEVSISYSIHLD